MAAVWCRVVVRVRAAARQTVGGERGAQLGLAWLVWCVCVCACVCVCVCVRVRVQVQVQVLVAIDRPGGLFGRLQKRVIYLGTAAFLFGTYLLLTQQQQVGCVRPSSAVAHAGRHYKHIFLHIPSLLHVAVRTYRRSHSPLHVLCAVGCGRPACQHGKV